MITTYNLLKKCRFKNNFEKLKYEAKKDFKIIEKHKRIKKKLFNDFNL